MSCANKEMICDPNASVFKANTIIRMRLGEDLRLLLETCTNRRVVRENEKLKTRPYFLSFLHHTASSVNFELY